MSNLLLPYPLYNNKNHLLGIPFSNISLEKALQKIHQLLSKKFSSSLFFINAHCLNTAYNNNQYRQTLKNAELILPDGSGIKYGCKLIGNPLVKNLNGTDLFPYLCQLFTNQKKSIYLLGASPGTVGMVKTWLKSHYPKLHVAGTQHGYFSESQTDNVINHINQSRADVLFVALGVPKQELWITQYKYRLNTKLNIAVGGLFDFYGENIRRAPLWMRNRGIEWAWRLLQEPKRMWRRYLIGNPLFIFRAWRENISNIFLQHYHHNLVSRRRRMVLSLRANLKRSYWAWRKQNVILLKRTLDIILSTIGLILLTPLSLLIIIAIFLESPGPVFFQQVRVGYRGKPFVLWKFRSMNQNAEQQRASIETLNEIQGGVTFKIKDDPRVTKVGRILRKLSFDEIPQLWNVLKGEMSLVGPRPALYSEVEKYSLAQRKRLDAIPGLTSDWVIAGRSRVPFIRQAELDIDYVHRRSLWRDLKLIFQTIPSLIRGLGAY